LFLLGDLLEVLVDNSDSEENTSSRSDGSHEVGEDAESTNADSTEGGSGVNVFGKLLDHGGFSPSLDHEFLVHELAHDIAGGLSGDVDPESGEEGARAHDEHVVEERVEGIGLNLHEILRRGDVVSKSADRGSLAMLISVSPLSNERHEVVTRVLSVEHLREEVEVGGEGSLQNDGDVRGIEQLDGVGHFVTTYLSVTQSQFNAESLEVDNYKEDNHSSQQAGNVRRVFTVEGVLEGQHFVGLSQQGVEEGDDGTFEFGVLLSLDRNR